MIGGLLWGGEMERGVERWLGFAVEKVELEVEVGKWELGVCWEGGGGVEFWFWDLGLEIHQERDGGAFGDGDAGAC